MSNNFKNTKLSPPWALFYHEIEALFGKDPDIKLEYDEDNIEIRLYVNGVEKAEALEQLLPTEKFFGGVCLNIKVIPANSDAAVEPYSVFAKAFRDNPVLDSIVNVDDIFSNPISYVIFKKEVVQYYSDNLADAHGVTSTLYENLARDVFGTPKGIHFCTNTEESTGRDLGDWPCK